jgi:hypothetical protein
MSNKTPYEIRLDVLAMAKDYFDKLHSANLAFAQEAFRQAVALNTATLDQWKTFAPECHTADDILKKAAEFYAFISKKE